MSSNTEKLKEGEQDDCGSRTSPAEKASRVTISLQRLVMSMT